MAVGMLLQVPQFTQGHYERVMEAMDWDSRPQPEGFVAHFAGPTDDGWCVFDVWESQEAFGRFAEERLKPALEQVVGDMPPIQPQFIQLHNQIGVPAHA